LQLAISKLEERLQQKQDEHSRRSLENLQNLKEDYSIQYKEKFE
jgi:kinase-associated protein B